MYDYIIVGAGSAGCRFPARPSEEPDVTVPPSEGRCCNPMMDAFVEAGEQAGLARNEDFNGPIQDGVGLYQLTQREGRRCSAAVAYLHPAMERPNLTVETHLQVERVVVEGMRA